VHRGQVSHSRGQVRVNGALAMVTDEGKVLR
jgi:stalled ribosome alternative rescue factor ArfA